MQRVKTNFTLFYFMEKALVSFVNPDNGDKVTFLFKFDQEQNFLDYDYSLNIKNKQEDSNNLIKTLSAVFINSLHGKDFTENDCGESSVQDSNSN